MTREKSFQSDRLSSRRLKDARFKVLTPQGQSSAAVSVKCVFCNVMKYASGSLFIPRRLPRLEAGDGNKAVGKHEFVFLCLVKKGCEEIKF